MEQTYTTFLRSCRNFREFASAPKIKQDEGLSFEDAREACKNYNSNLTENEIELGTKLEFVKDEDFFE
jgi:hypothetical protein